MATYVALVHGEPGSYGVSLPDLPGCTSGGATIDVALAHLRLAASNWVEEVAAGGHPIPPARPIDELRADPDYAEDFEDVEMVAAVEVDLPGGVERLSITMSDALLAKIDKAAKEAGESRSGWLAMAARLRLHSEVAAAFRTTALAAHAKKGRGKTKLRAAKISRGPAKRRASKA